MSTFGIDWTAEQNSIVVEAYFEMLLQEQDGTRYVKAEYNRNVQSRTGKTRGSVERKFQNISFLLQEMGHPTIAVYKPRSNAQRGTLYDAISRHLQANQYPPLFAALENDANLRGAFNPESLEDARTETYGRIVLRRGQPAFRRELLEAYGGQCAVTGYDSEFALEACHIVPYRGPDTNHVSNGLLLRADIHTLFDLGKTGVDTYDMSVILADGMTQSSYADLAGTSITLPQDPSKRPSAAALDQHRFLVGLQTPQH